MSPGPEQANHIQTDLRGSSSHAAGRDLTINNFYRTDWLDSLGTLRPQAGNTGNTGNDHPPCSPTSGPTPEGNEVAFGVPTHSQRSSDGRAAGASTRSTSVQSAPGASSATHDIIFPRVPVTAALPTETVGTRAGPTGRENRTYNVGTSRGVPQSSSASTGQQVSQVNAQDGSIEAATLDILIDQLIDDSTRKKFCFPVIHFAQYLLSPRPPYGCRVQGYIFYNLSCFHNR
jgi:hypothetical protein